MRLTKQERRHLAALCGRDAADHLRAIPRLAHPRRKGKSYLQAAESLRLRSKLSREAP